MGYNYHNYDYVKGYKEGRKERIQDGIARASMVGLLVLATYIEVFDRVCDWAVRDERRTTTELVSKISSYKGSNEVLRATVARQGEGK